MPNSTPERHTLLVFGATGDLAHRKVLPSLFDLHRHGSAKGRAIVIGVARATMTDDQFRDSLRTSMAKGDHDAQELEHWLKHHVFFQSLGDSSPAAYLQLRPSRC